MRDGRYIDKGALVAWLRWKEATHEQVTLASVLEYIRSMPYYAVIFSEEVQSGSGFPDASS